MISLNVTILAILNSYYFFLRFIGFSFALHIRDSSDNDTIYILTFPLKTRRNQFALNDGMVSSL